MMRADGAYGPAGWPVVRGVGRTGEQLVRPRARSERARAGRGRSARASAAVSSRPVRTPRPSARSCDPLERVLGGAALGRGLALRRPGASSAPADDDKQQRAWLGSDGASAAHGRKARHAVVPSARRATARVTPRRARVGDQGLSLTGIVRAVVAPAASLNVSRMAIVTGRLERFRRARAFAREADLERSGAARREREAALADRDRPAAEAEALRGRRVHASRWP